MYAIVLVVTILVNGQPNVTRHIMPERFGYGNECSDKLRAVMRGLHPKKNVQVGGSCEIQDDAQA